MAEPDKAWEVVHEAILAFGMKVPDLGKARAALLRVIREGAWKHYVPPIGEPCEPPTFREWIVAKVPRGLETTEENLWQIAQGDRELYDELVRLLRRKPGDGNHDNIMISQQGVTSRPRKAAQGTSAEYALSRLRKSRPDLHAEVLAGRLSAHAAMVKAGFRPKTFTVRPDPKSAARALRKHMSPEDLRTLARLLLEEEDA